MGYTHYWTINKVNATQYKNALVKVKEFIEFCQKEKGFKLANGMGDEGTSPVFNERGIFFNGVGEQSHETAAFFNNLSYAQGFHFCKTNHKEYDPVVVGAILTLKCFHPNDIDISSDGVGMYKGEPEFDILDGVKLFLEFYESINYQTVNINNHEIRRRLMKEILSWFNLDVSPSVIDSWLY